MVKIKLAVVRNNGNILKRGIYGAAEDAANHAKKAQESAIKKQLKAQITCKFEEFDINEINISDVDLTYWTHKYRLLQLINYNTKEPYWQVFRNNTPDRSGLNDPTFTEAKAHEYFAELLNTKVCKPGIKVYFMELADGTKLREIA